MTTRRTVTAVLVAGVLIAAVGSASSLAAFRPRTLAAFQVAASQSVVPFTLRPNDHICIIGNALAERMQYDGWLETRLYARFPKHSLVVRNLGWSGDEIATRLRSKNFGTPDEWLSASPAPIGGYSDNRFEGVNTKADVIFAFFGYNESFAGEQGLDAFKKALSDWLTHTVAQKYNDTSAPRVVLFSPIAHEDLRNPDLPDGRDNNQRLALYTRAMAEVAQAHRVRFVDLFAPSRQLYAASSTRLTINGIHLTEEGNRRVSDVIDRALFGAAPAVTPAFLDRLRLAVIDKSRIWFDRYRVTDGFATYGDRAFLTFIRGNPRDVNPSQVKNKADVLPTNYEVLQRESQVLDVMTANRDRRIWAVAQGQDARAAALKIDDSDTPPPIDALTNEPGKGPNGAHVYVDGEQAIQQMTLGRNIKVELFASEREFPELINPVQMSFDTKGRLWVAAWKNYPHWQPKTAMDDKLLILEDTNGDGKADKRTVFAGDLNNPTGFEFWNGGVLLAQAPNLVFLKDTNGDDRYDVKQIVLSGFDTADTHHTMNSFTFDPGGALYFQEGIFNRTQVESPWGPPNRQADGGVYRFEPRTWKIETYLPMNFPNPHGHVFDSWGRDIVTDATGGQPYYGPSMSAKQYYPAMVKKDDTQRPGVVRMRPVGGTALLSSRQFPEDMQGNFLVLNDITLRGILNYKVSEDAAGLKIEEVEPLMQSADENFRPVDAEVGPDGALYVADWHNALIGHMQHNLRDTSRDHLHGRIYRVTYAGRPLLQPAKIAGEPIPRLLDLLKEPEDRVRYRAKIELSARDTTEVLAALKTWTDGLDSNDPNYEHHMMEALWVHQWHNRVNEPLLKRMLRSKEPLARAAATRVLCYWRDRIADPLALLKIQVNDEHPSVRLEAVRAASFFQTPSVAAIALESLGQPQDRYLQFTLDLAMNTLKPPELLFDVSPRAVEYQLGRLSNDEIVRLERRDTDPKYRPVYFALLTRQGLTKEIRDEALAALTKVDRTPPPVVLIEALEKARAEDVSLGDKLVALLLAQPPASLRAQRALFENTIAASTAPVARRGAYGALLLADGNADAIWQDASSHPDRLADAMLAMAAVRPDTTTFRRLARQVDGSDEAVRRAAVRGLHMIPDAAWPPQSELASLGAELVALVRRAPPASRTEAGLVDALRLAERVAAALPDAARLTLRRDLRALGVRVVSIATLPEQMAFDLRWFAVEAGSSLQLVLTNADAMPHNLVIGAPKSVQAIGTTAMSMSMPSNPAVKPFVPSSPLVLQATKLLQEGETARLAFTVPSQPGEYVFLCSYPGHWIRMYGVMLVVQNLEAWEAHPAPPIDPVTNQPFTSQR